MQPHGCSGCRHHLQNILCLPSPHQIGPHKKLLATDHTCAPLCWLGSLGKTVMGCSVESMYDPWLRPCSLMRCCTPHLWELSQPITRVDVRRGGALKAGEGFIIQLDLQHCVHGWLGEVAIIPAACRSRG